MSEEKPGINVETGEFPYPLIDGPKESRYLTWIRNHSNYMAERGFLDYLRMVAVLVRGILVNALTLLPWLLLLSILLSIVYAGLLNDWENKTEPEKSSYLATPWVIAAAGLYILIFPIVSRLFRVAGHKTAVEKGSASNVKLRDRYERSFGACLLAIITVVAIETLPLLVHWFHIYAVDGVGWQWTLAGAVSAIMTANKVLPLIGGRLKKVLMVLVGLLGIFIPLLFIIFVSEFLVYSDHVLYRGPLNFALVVIPFIIFGSILLALVLGWGGLGSRGKMRVVLYLVGSVCFAIAVVIIVVGVLLADKREGNYILVAAWAAVLFIYCRLNVNVNSTSINGLYRDRLASAFLVGADTEGDVDIERDIDLQEICKYEAGSKAPYHLINVAHNLQASKDISIRERNCDFFIFSKKFIGGNRTGYCRSEHMEQVFPQIDLGTAMAISAAAASPNMGKGTNPLMVAFMTLLNVRLGFWIPNPGKLEKELADKEESDLRYQERDLAKEQKRLQELEGTKLAQATKKIARQNKLLDELKSKVTARKNAAQLIGERKNKPAFEFTFKEVFEEEHAQINQRREQAYSPESQRPLAATTRPTTAHELVGIGYSGGGIRSATVNLGISQALDKRGVFDHIDYMSTVSGGGYLGSSISALMRYKVKSFTEYGGIVTAIEENENEKIVKIDDRSYTFTEDADLDDKIVQGAQVQPGQRLLRRETGSANPHNSLMEQFRWRVRPGALWQEMRSKLDETHDWVNLSDGGHLENLATFELLRRRCKYIITGDGEADPNLWFNGLATLIRFARIDLGIQIQINPEQLQLIGREHDPDKTDRRSTEHFAVGRIHYPKIRDKEGNLIVDDEYGMLLYLKSSFTGDEDEVVKEYRHRNPTFPHESTADQFFDENQLEAYRALGQHIAERALRLAPQTPEKLSFADLEKWFEELDKYRESLVPKDAPPEPELRTLDPNGK